MKAFEGLSDERPLTIRAPLRFHPKIFGANIGFISTVLVFVFLKIVLHFFTHAGSS